ncbi:hypothetical protein KJY77_05685, partial [Canibacter sp. lx-72]|uniref:hypothetical protein n=1 Tax=Canibacter zhuwentaonis TaxID=2837491 RepID=UPI001BDCF4B6
AGALFLGGCSGSRGFVSYADINKEYQESVAKLNWPAGYTPPESLREDEEGGSYQRGFGDTAASTAYECAWYKEWLKTYATDEQAANNALTHLDKVLDMGYLSKERAHESVRQQVRNNLEKARLGDPSEIQSFVTANCGG